MTSIELGTVMLIDDSRIDNFINCKILELNTVTENVLVYEDAAKALEHLRTSPEIPDYIFLDIYMPTLTGFDFLEEFALLPSRISQHSKVVVLSSAFDHLELEKLRKFNFISNLIVKPLTLESIEELTVKSQF